MIRAITQGEIEHSVYSQMADDLEVAARKRRKGRGKVAKKYGAEQLQEMRNRAIAGGTTETTTTTAVAAAAAAAKASVPKTPPPSPVSVASAARPRAVEVEEEEIEL